MRAGNGVEVEARASAMDVEPMLEEATGGVGDHNSCIIPSTIEVRG
jgi:hypothetical protein